MDTPANQTAGQEVSVAGDRLSDLVLAVGHGRRRIVRRLYVRRRGGELRGISTFSVLFWLRRTLV